MCFSTIEIYFHVLISFQMSDSPAVKDLPKLDSTISAEIAKDHKLKPTEVKTFSRALSSGNFPKTNYVFAGYRKSGFTYC